MEELFDSLYGSNVTIISNEFLEKFLSDVSPEKIKVFLFYFWKGIKEGYTISSLVFFHIPLQEYVTAYDLYQQGSSEVKYYFGENNDEVMDVSDHPSKLFDTAVELGSTKGMFCGHDHYNNTSIEYKGIRLTYGMSIDYLAMPGIARDTKQRGATLITTHKDSSFDIEQVGTVSGTTPSMKPRGLRSWPSPTCST